MHTKNFILLLVFCVTLLSSTRLFAKDSNITAFVSNVGIAVVDTEYLFTKFASNYNLRDKIMNDYKLLLNKAKYSKDLSSDEKQQLATSELDKIIMHYSYQISNIITEVLNDLIKEHSLSLVINKRSFSMKKALFSPENQRNKTDINKDKLNIKDSLCNSNNFFDQLDNYYNQPILSTSYNYIDLTDEAYKRINKMGSRIKILSYGRILK